MLDFFLIVLLCSLRAFCSKVVPDEAKALLCKPFTSKSALSEEYLQNAALFFPSEVWVKILRECDPAAIWSMSMVNRFFASHIRDDKNEYKERFLTPKAVYEIVYMSDLTIKPWMQIYFDRFTKTWRKDFKGDCCDESNKQLNTHLLKIIVSRAPDAGSLFMFFQDRNAPFPEALLPLWISWNLWTCPSLHTSLPDYPVNQSFVFWLPTDNAYFLEHLDDKMIVAITSQDIFTHFFDAALISHYLIPSWKGERQLSSGELQRIKSLSSTAFYHLYDYASHLHVAIYYLTGDIDPDSTWLMRKFYKFWADLGFDVSGHLLSRLPSDLCDYDAVVRYHYPINTILKTAQVWGLDAKDLAIKYDNSSPIKDESVQAYLTDSTPHLPVPASIMPLMVLSTMAVPLSVVVNCYVRQGKIVLKRRLCADERVGKKRLTNRNQVVEISEEDGPTDSDFVMGFDKQYT